MDLKSSFLKIRSVRLSQTIKIYLALVAIAGWMGYYSLILASPIQDEYLAVKEGRLQQFKNMFIDEYISDPLWKERDAYDAGHYMMVPLHFAFLSDDRELRGNRSAC